MLRQALFQVHWILGITAGVVLSVVGFTGAMLTFEDELLRGLNREVMEVAPQAQEALSLGDLFTRVQQANPGQRILALGLSSDPRAAVRVSFERRDKAGAGERGRRADIRFADPYSGALLGAAHRGEKFFQVTRQVHRYLAAGEVGKQIVGAATLALLFFCVSGLYLRWPARARDWRAWLKPNLGASGRQFLWQLHAVIATWALLFYLLAGFTGLYWSYDWYRDALVSWSGAPRPAQPANRESGEVVKDQPLSAAMLERDWQLFQRESGGGFRTATVTLPSRAGQPLEIRYLAADAPHERAFSSLRMDAQTGAVLRHDRYAERGSGARLVGSIFPLHSGSYFGLPGQVLMMAASLTMPFFAITGWLMYLKRRARKRRALSPGSISPADPESA
jgi:sulfite reductase (NADPH) flavoprotein alpha-component